MRETDPKRTHPKHIGWPVSISLMLRLSCQQGPYCLLITLVTQLVIAACLMNDSVMLGEKERDITSVPAT
jgi:hypothetical protein